MKKILVISLLFLLLNSNAFAISDIELSKRCLAKGVEKLALLAESRGCTFNSENIVVDDVDNRLMNPSKYIWYSVDADCGKSTEFLIKIVQYYNGKCY